MRTSINSPKVDNSFYNQNYQGFKALIIVPHQDDEINTAGSLIRTLCASKASVYIVYTTNGDWKYPARKRMKETIKATSLLGVSKENLVFLGYGDSFNNSKGDHLFYSGGRIIESSSGHEETYGTDLFDDYIYSRTKKHHKYTSNNYLNDLISVIREIHADLIICTDFDEHPDHRMLSLYFDRAMGIIRKTDNEYKPTVWKRFAYSVSYTSIGDYSSFNNPETQYPIVGKTLKYEKDIVNTSIYDWESRIRIPIAKDSYGSILGKNIIVKALKAHRSQYIITHADRILNSDEVYWNRRTDSLSYSAHVSVSSGNANYLNDFLLYNVEEVDSAAPKYGDYYWRPCDDDLERTVSFEWDDNQSISEIVLYGTIDKLSGISQIEVSLDDGFSVVTDLPENGNPRTILLKETHFVKKCSFKIIVSYGTEYGISEVEFYKDPDSSSAILPYCKILIKNNFAYDYIINKKANCLPLSIYTYGRTGAISLFVKEGKSKIRDNILIINPEDHNIVVRAENYTGEIYDQISIRIVNDQELRFLERQNKKVRRYLNDKKRMLKINNMKYILCHQGIMAVIKRTIHNIILPKIRKT